MNLSLNIATTTKNSLFKDQVIVFPPLLNRAKSERGPHELFSKVSCGTFFVTGKVLPVRDTAENGVQL